MLCRAAKELPGAAGKSGIIADWGLRPAPLSNARYRSLSDHADISQHQTATDHFSSQPAYGQRVVLVQFFGLKLIALTVAAIVARCSSIAAE